MIVSNCIGANRTEHIKQSVSISVLHDVAQTVLKVDREVRRKLTRCVRETCFELDGLGRGEARLDQRLWFVWEGTRAHRGKESALLRCQNLLWYCAGENHMYFRYLL